MSGPETGWRRLDPRTVLATSALAAGVAGGAALPALFALGGRMPLARAVLLVLAGAVLVTGGGAAAGWVRRRRTRYRIGPERAELHTGVLLVKRRSLPRERIRSVDLSARPLLRALGLVTVRIGTGEQTGSGESTLLLDAVSRQEGERLRKELLDRGVPVAGGEGHRDGTLAVLDLRWIRYAPVSFVAPLLGGAAVGAVLQVSEWFGVRDRVIGWTWDHLRDVPLLWAVPALAAFALLTGVVGALGLWIEMWSGYRLEREPGGTLRVRRGLLTSRSISLEERRLRGVDLVEPLGARILGGIRLDAVATGLATGGGEHASSNVLAPVAPRAAAQALAALVLREPVSPVREEALTRHPPAARTRRLRWALSAALAPAALLALLGLLFTGVLLWTALVVAAVAVPVAVLLALDAYRNLGHGTSGAYLLTRSGTLRRSTVALQRSGVIGWTVRQSVFQRRAGLLTLAATTAAGAGAYEVRDAARDEALEFADAAVPGLLAPFLERGSGPRRGAQAPGAVPPARGARNPG
ncbi:PH domain-containing protein [Streptomyces sp. NPDC048001]|uniref:PH domain-containing protein n=1 Tax=Streptomyces sp. NPDC048001 TaxID=3365498 RepID=UPI00371AACDF